MKKLTTVLMTLFVLTASTALAAPSEGDLKKRFEARYPSRDWILPNGLQAVDVPHVVDGTIGLALDGLELPITVRCDDLTGIYATKTIQ